MNAADRTDYAALPREEVVRILAEEDRELDLPSFDLGDAWALGTRVREAGLERSAPVSIAVSLGGQRAFHSGLPGSAPLNDAWLDRKFRTVAHYGRSTLAVRYDHLVMGVPFEQRSRLDPELYADAGGAFPLRIRGVLVGAVGVSGLEMHEDHAMVVAALRAHVRAGD